MGTSEKLYFEDLFEGQSFELGSYTIEKAEILEFAKKYDPQPFHIDEAAAKNSIYGSLIASGWHTTAIYMKIFVGSLMDKVHMMGSPGIEDLRWKKPVLPGDTLSAVFTIREKKSFKGNLGLVRAYNEMKNQEGKVVMDFTGRMLFAKKLSS